VIEVVDVYLRVAIGQNGRGCGGPFRIGALQRTLKMFARDDRPAGKAADAAQNPMKVNNGPAAGTAVQVVDVLRD
jgi:hypothetical protein